MATVTFTRKIHPYLAADPAQVEGATVGKVLHRVFERLPRARRLVLDDQGAVRQHVAIFVDGTPVRDRAILSNAVGADSRVDVMQALSGG